MKRTRILRAFRSHEWGPFTGAGEHRGRRCLRCGCTNYAGHPVDGGESRRVHAPWPDTRFTEEECGMLVVREVLES